MLRQIFPVIAVLGAAQAAMAQQCPLSANAGGAIEGRLSALESQFTELSGRMDRVERLVTRLAEVSANVVANQAVGSRGMAEPEYRLVSLAEDRPAAISPPSGVLSQSETGRVEFRCFGAANVNLALAGGGYIAVGNQAARASGNVASADDSFSSPSAYVPSYYRYRAQQRAAVRPASYSQY